MNTDQHDHALLLSDLSSSVEKIRLGRERRSWGRRQFATLFDFEQPPFDFLLSRKRVLSLGLSLEGS